MSLARGHEVQKRGKEKENRGGRLFKRDSEYRVRVIIER
jgi:hypothetical protein